MTLLSGQTARTAGIRPRLDIMPYLFILPAVAIYVVFNLGPVLASFVFSFFKWDLLSPTAEFAGLSHYNFILNDDRFWNALGHNFIFLGLAVVIPVWIGLLLAVFIYEIRRGRVFFRAALFLPAIFSGVVIAYVWKWIYHPFAGVLNPALELVGLGRVHAILAGRPQNRALLHLHRLCLGDLRLFDGHLPGGLAGYPDRYF